MNRNVHVILTSILFQAFCIKAERIYQKTEREMLDKEKRMFSLHFLSYLLILFLPLLTGISFPYIPKLVKSFYILRSTVVAKSCISASFAFKMNSNNPTKSSVYVKKLLVLKQRDVIISTNIYMIAN